MAFTKEIDYTVNGEGQPMDINREEFIRFQQLVMEKSGPMVMRHLLPVLALMACVTLIPEVITLLKGDTTYWLFTAVSAVVAVAALVLWAVMPPLLKRRMGKLYDRFIEAGHSHYGLCRVCYDRVEKVKYDFTLTVPLDATCLIIEDAAMFVVMNTRRQAVILPARFVTPEQADILHQVVQRLNPRQYRFKSSLVPGGLTAVAPAMETRQVAFEGEIEYTNEEYVTVSKEFMAMQFWQRAPIWVMTTTLCSLMVEFSSEDGLLATVAAFLLLMGINWLINWQLPRTRIARAIAAGAVPAEARRMTIQVDDKGVRLIDKNQGQAAVPWSAIKHVYDAKPFVKFVGHQQVLFLPQRYVEDLTVFSADLDNFRKR